MIYKDITKGLIATIAILAAFAHAPLPQARSQHTKPAFEQLIVKCKSGGGFASFSQFEELKFEPMGRCWYKVEGRQAGAGGRARAASEFNHILTPERIERINKLLKDTQWLTAPGGAGPAGGVDHYSTVVLTLNRDGKEVSVECNGKRPEPYASLLFELRGLQFQERTVYLLGYRSEDAGARAWREVGEEVAALREGRVGKAPLSIDYRRYIPIAQQICRDFLGAKEDEIIPALRLVGHFKVKSELKYLHRMASDQRYNVRQELALALLQCHDEESLPVLAGMVAATGSNGLDLIQWGDAAVPHIVRLIAQSTDDKLKEREHVSGENVIRSYLDYAGKIARPIDPRVVTAVRQALESLDPTKSAIRTTYHKMFLKRFGGSREHFGIFDRSNLVAWCIVPFDSKNRSPAERAAMIKRLGLSRVAYDWRDTHVPTFEDEILEYKKTGIEYFAFWDVHPKAFELFAKHDLHPQIWKTAPSPAGESQEQRVAAAAKQLSGLAAQSRAMKCKLGLYNHGDWGGEPKNLVAVCKALRAMPGNDHVGIVYNLHHGHDHIDDFRASLEIVLPYLLCMNLNGMAYPKDGPKILQLGAGEHEVRFLKLIRDFGYSGPLGIIGHTNDDVEARLRDNLDGLDWILPQLDGGEPGPRPNYRTR